MATDKPRYTVSVDAELFQKIEDFRFEHRFQTRSEATSSLFAGVWSSWSGRRRKRKRAALSRKL